MTKARTARHGRFSRGGASICSQVQTTAKSVAFSPAGNLVVAGAVKCNSLVENRSATVYTRNPGNAWSVAARLAPADGRSAWFG